MDPTHPEVTLNHNQNTNSEDGTHKPKAVSYTSQEYADMKNDPSMRYVYSSQRPAAGYPSPPLDPHNPEPFPTGRRHYKSGDDTNESTPALAPLGTNPSPSPSRHVKSEGVSKSNSKMKGDPSKSHLYSSKKPVAGSTLTHVPSKREPSPSSRRHYKTANDTTDSAPRNMSPSHRIKPSYSNQEYADMKGDPSMKYVYSSQRPAAGYPSPPVDPHNSEPHPTGRRHYKTGSDTNDSGMDKSGTFSPGPL